jgi:hypothetical protein
VTVDHFLSRRYHEVSYNCLHFTREVWMSLTGDDIGDRLSALWDHPSARRARRGDLSQFRRLDRPQNPSLVLMHRPRCAPHAGVFLRGRILHLTEMGAEFLTPELATRGFKSWSCYL